jgi:hypothetical protein
MSIEVESEQSGGRVGLVEPELPAVELPVPPSAARAGGRRRRWPLIVGLAGVLVLALAGGAIAANSALSQTYSPQRAVADYLALQRRGDAKAMWAGATYERGDGSYALLFDQTALGTMMQLPENSKLRDVRVISTRQLDSARREVEVTLMWNGVPRALTFTVHRDPNASHWLLYPSWKVEIPYSTVSVTLPNQPGAIRVDGIGLPAGASQTSVQVIQGFHEVTMLESPLLDQASQKVDAVGSTPISLPGTISTLAKAAAANAVRYGFGHCTSTDGCFDHTYTAPDNNFIYYMTLPGYGNVNYTKYVIALTGDPTATMKLTVLADTGKVSVSGPCTSTYTIDGRRQYSLKGDFSGTLTLNGTSFDSDLGWDCASAKG